MRSVRRVFAAVIFCCALASSSAVLAQGRGSPPGDVPRGPPPGRPPDRPVRRSIPELDPAAAGAIAAIVAGGTVLVARRRKK